METLEHGISSLSIESESIGEVSFHLFSELPSELRLQIWGQAVDALPGRIISLWVNEWYQDRGLRFRMKQPCPELGNVCREARAAVCQIYLPLFPMQPQHSQTRVCLQKDTIILSEDFSTLYEQDFEYNAQYYYLPRLLEALGPEKCREVRELALEVRTNWQWGRYRIEDWHLHPWEGHYRHTIRKTAHEIFPKLEKITYVPCIGGRYREKYCDSYARAHVGVLKFVPRQSGVWVKGRKKWANQVSWKLDHENLHNIREPGLEYEIMQLDIVGGRKKLCWDRAPDSNSFPHWKLMTKDELEKDEARRKDIEQKRRQRLGLEPLR